MSCLKAVSKSLQDEIQPRKTYLGAEIEPVHTGLPKTTSSLCPECKQLLLARVFEEDGQVIMRKCCPQHGWFKDVLSPDVDFYLRMEDWFFGDGQGLMNPAITDATNCPYDCGLCNLHASHTALANIDLTNRCNLRCPICFANADATGYVYEPTYGQVVEMMRRFREMKPVPATCIQFSGGEPTLHHDFLDIVREAREMEFSAVQIASNGIEFAKPFFAWRAKEAGVHSIYLQFDGVSDDVYKKMRGRELLDTKMAVIENAREAGINVVFVPTIVKRVNDHQVGDIVKLAIKNFDVVSGVSFQPVAFTGRISTKEREQQRFTIPDLAHCIEEQTGFVKAKDWVPLACSAPISGALSTINGKKVTTYTCHPHCSAATYLFVDDDGKATQFTDFVDFKNMLQELDAMAARRVPPILSWKLLSEIRVVRVLKKHFDAKKAPKGLTFTKFIRTLRGLTSDKYRSDRDKVIEGTYSTLMIGGMHFMDSYNYDVQRVQRCIVHYAAPNGRIYPFCAYNAGPCYREKVEREFSERPRPPEVI